MLQAALLGFASALFLPGLALGAPDAAPDECRHLQVRLWVDLGHDGSWEALRLADRCAALPGLSGSRRAEALTYGAELRSLLGDYAGAEQALEGALRLRPGYAEASFLLAQLTRDRPEQALQHAEQAARAAESTRRRAAAHRLAGEIQLDLGDKAGAKSSLARALELAGDDLESLRAMVWITRDEPVTAAAYARRARRASESVPSWQRAAAHRLCARILLDVKDYPGAMASLRRALEIDPDDLTALRAMLQIKHERPQEAPAPAGEAPSVGPAGGAGIEADPARSLEADPDDLEGLRALVAVKRAENRLTEAVASAERFTAAIQRAPAWQQPDAYRLSAQMWLELGDPRRAIRSLNRSDQLDFLSIATNRLFSRIPGTERSWKLSLVSAYLAGADARVELGDPEGAYESLNRALELFPADVRILQSMVELQLSRSRPEEALAFAERLVAASEKETLGDVMERDLTQDLLIVAARKSGVPLERAIEVDLKDPRVAERTRRGLEKDRMMALQTMAKVQSARGRPEEALDYAQRMLKASEKSPSSERAVIYRQVAQMQRELKDEAGAETSLKRALELARDEISALHEMVQLKLAQGRPEEALAYAQRLVQASENASSSERAGVHWTVARVQRELKDEAGAEASLERALESTGDYPPALKELVQLKLAQGRPEEVLSLVAGHLPADSRLQAPWLVLRGLARTMLKEDSAARDDFSAAVRLDPKTACFDEIVLKNRGRLDPFYFDLCVTRFPGDPGLYLDRGVARYRSGQQRGALADFRKAVELNPDYPEAHLSLASALTGQHHPNEALAAAERAFELVKDRKGPLYDQIVALRSSLREAARKTKP